MWKSNEQVATMTRSTVAAPKSAPPHGEEQWPTPTAEGEPNFVSVVIPTYNEESYIAACLDSLSVQDYPADRFELLVVDGGSHDRTREIVRAAARERPNIHLLDNPKRATAAGLNIGIRRSRGDAVTILGAHSYVAPDFLTQVDYHLNHVDASCVGPRWQTVGRTYQARAIALAMSSRFGVGNAAYRVSRRSGFVDTCGFATYRRAVFERIGYFDEHLARSNEDYEFNRRLINAGERIYMSPSIKACYYTRSSILGAFRQYFRYGHWKIDALRKAPGSFLFRYQVPVVFILTLLLTAVVGAFIPAARLLLAAVLGTYLIVSIAWSVYLAARNDLRCLPVLPLAFMALHFGFGLGFAGSLLRHLATRLRGRRSLPQD